VVHFAIAVRILKLMEIDSTSDLLRFLNITSETLSFEQRTALDESGFLIIRPSEKYLSGLGINTGEISEALDRLTDLEGWRGGQEGKEDWVSPERSLDPGSNRLANLIEKHSCFSKLITVPEIIAAVHHVIRDELKVGAVDMREPRKGTGHQRIHIDWLARECEDSSYDCVFVGFFLDGMNAENGAIRVVPGSHRWLGWPDAHFDVNMTHPAEIQVAVEPGTFIVMNANTWHAGAVNPSGKRRRTVYVDYRKRALPQLLNQKQYLSKQTIERLSPAEQFLLGVREKDPISETKSFGPGAAYRQWLASRGSVHQ